jgi:hypothetical protein
MTPRDQAIITAFLCKIFDMTELRPLFDSRRFRLSDNEEWGKLLQRIT